MKHNSYANGGLQSLGFSDKGLATSVGVVDPGRYTFTTDSEETIQCLTGLLVINNESCAPGQKVVINKGVTFTIEAKESSSYICTYR